MIKVGSMKLALHGGKNKCDRFEGRDKFLISWVKSRENKFSRIPSKTTFKCTFLIFSSDKFNEKFKYGNNTIIIKLYGSIIFI